MPRCSSLYGGKLARARARVCVCVRAPVRAHIYAIYIYCIYTGRLIMYSGITKICYWKTVGHVFTKPVQIEETTQFFSPVGCFSS